MRRSACLAAVAVLLMACGGTADTPATIQLERPTTVVTIAAAGTAAPTTATVASTTTAITLTDANVETRAIVDRWVEAWMAEDVDGVVALYAEDGVYADTGCPFEMNGSSAIRSMVTGHLSSTDYTLVEIRSITYTDAGAVVEWIWGGINEGDPFTMEPATTFEIRDGLIIRSTDSYDRADAPPAWEAACIAYNA